MKKTILSLTLALGVIVCSAQTAPKKIQFSKYETFKQQEHDLTIKDRERLQKHFYHQDSLYSVFIWQIITANGVDPKKVSANGDSLKITKEGIELKLKK